MTHSRARRQKIGLTAALAIVGAAGLAMPAAAEDPKEQIALLYTMQIAPKACKWDNVGDSAKLDAKVAEAEKALGLTEEEKTKYKKLAEASFKATAEDCDPKGLARAMYDEAVK